MLNWQRKKSFEADSFDMTPIIDVVFLLIIFFMLVCQFIAAEQFKVDLPDEIASSEKQPAQEDKTLTITVMRTESGQTRCAIGPTSSISSVLETTAMRFVDSCRVCGRSATTLGGRHAGTPQRSSRR